MPSAGETALFTQDDSVEAAWRVVDPALTAQAPVLQYAPGSWGPAAADGVLQDQDIWHDPHPEKTQPC